ncbi:DUF1990 family protein [Streptomyces sp. NBC_01262]|uniref:DUF1990 family protein n=1 Tax=Streptomyces sp. NBC_01262 TaxID=2903803 RepID=UPI002E2F4097|nr:DUF1990 domain-containing protein [Streptomyces sp. NBC_01262]
MGGVTDGFTYAEVGATRDPGSLPPPGFHLLRERTRLGDGPEVFTAAGRALLGWRMQRAAGLRVDPAATDAAPGVRVVMRAGPVRIPCEVVWTVREERRTGFAYGTLAGHPECGEESFVVEQEDDGSVWLTVTAFSRPAAWYLRAAGPVTRMVQRAAARRYGRCLRRLTQDQSQER